MLLVWHAAFTPALRHGAAQLNARLPRSTRCIWRTLTHIFVYGVAGSSACAHRSLRAQHIARDAASRCVCVSVRGVTSAQLRWRAWRGTLGMFSSPSTLVHAAADGAEHKLAGARADAPASDGRRHGANLSYSLLFILHVARHGVCGVSGSLWCARVFSLT